MYMKYRNPIHSARKSHCDCCPWLLGSNWSLPLDIFLVTRTQVVSASWHPWLLKHRQPLPPMVAWMLVATAV